MDIKCFSIDNNSIFLQRCLIFNDRIYSIKCLEKKFPNLSFEQIVKEHLNEINDCDIDIEFTKKE